MVLDYPIHLQEHERLKLNQIRLSLNPLIQVVNSYNFESLRHENVGEGYLLNLLEAKSKIGFDTDDKKLSKARILNPNAHIYNDDVLDSRQVESYHYVDCIITENLINNLNAVDIKSVIFSQQSNADYCIHYLKIIPEVLTAKKPFYGIDYFMDLKPFKSRLLFSPNVIFSTLRL